MAATVFGDLTITSEAHMARLERCTKLHIKIAISI